MVRNTADLTEDGLISDGRIRHTGGRPQGDEVTIRDGLDSHWCLVFMSALEGALDATNSYVT